VRTLGLAVVLSLSTATAAAAPWRYETGLAPRPPAGAPYTLEEQEAQAVAPDGHEFPSITFRGLSLGLIADTFATYKLASRQGQLFHEFELSRVQITGWASWRALAGINLTVETVRSSGGRSYLGVDGDSLVTRMKWAFAEATPLGPWLALRAGIVPDLLLQYVEASWLYRAQGPVGLERDALFTPGDLGVSLEGALPWRLGSVAVAFGNGEGITQREQNNGKNVTVALRIAPAPRRTQRLLLHALYRDGSLGAGSAADSRLAGGLTYAGQRLGAGAIGTWAMGYRGVGSRDAGHLTAWVRGTLPRAFFLYGRADLLWPSVADAGALQARVIAGAGYALPAIVRLYVSYEGLLPVGALRNQVPALEEHALVVVVEGRL